MHGTLVFIHGTGTREAGYRTTLGRVREGAEQYLDNMATVGVPWYKLRTDYPDLVTKALPAAGSRAAVEADSDPITTAWQLLVEDPRFELKILAEAAPPANEPVMIGGLSRSQQLVASVTGLSAEGKPLGGFLADEYHAAALRVGDAPELRDAAARTPDDGLPTLAEAASRAVVAELFVAHRDDSPGTQPEAMLIAEQRDALVDATYVALVGSSRGLGGWLLERLAGLGTGLGRLARGGLTDLSVGFFSDVFFYERRGEGIRSASSEARRGAQPPVMLIGHSLGGIASVDLLSSPTAPKVDLLVTVGSQAPLLFAMNALGTLEPPDRNRVAVARWVNVFDRNDLISFRASEIFADADAHVEDHEVSSGQPFPMSHGAYFVNPKFWQLLADHWQ
jgi:hypothetical protein